MLSLIYLIPATLKDGFAIHPALPVALDTLNTLFWFCAAVALAAKLGVHSCNNDVSTAGRDESASVQMLTSKGLLERQQHRQRQRQPQQAMHRSASLDRIPLVRLRSLPRLRCALRPQLAGICEPPTLRYPIARPGHEPGISEYYFR